MATIRPDCFLTGFLGSVDKTSLVVTTTQSQFNFLVCVNDSRKTAVALGSEGEFRAFECSDNIAYGGIIIPLPYFDLVLDSFTDPYEALEGDMIRHDDMLSIVTKSDRFSGSQGGLVQILDGLPRGQGVRANFRAWEISIAIDSDRQVLFRWEGPLPEGCR